MKCFMSNKECEYQINEKPYNVFILSPFGYPFDDLYTNYISPTLQKIKLKDIINDQGQHDVVDLDSALSSDRSDQALQLGFVMCQRICKKIQEARYIIADISQANPNVFYELGLSFSMRKNIILLSNSTIEGKLPTFGLIGKDNKNALIRYKKVTDLTDKRRFILALKESIRRKKAKTAKIIPQIINITNELSGSTKGLKEDILKKTINELKTKLLLENEWSVLTIPVMPCMNINEILINFYESKVFVVDTTMYDNHVNPFIFFCLGIAHGLEKEVIPLTNNQRNVLLPFDVKGLWHIFFGNLNELESEFKKVLPEIDRIWVTAKEDELYKNFWNPFLKTREIYIMTCARGTDVAYRGTRCVFR